MRKVTRAEVARLEKVANGKLVSHLLYIEGWGSLKSGNTIVRIDMIYKFIGNHIQPFALHVMEEENGKRFSLVIVD